MLTLFIDYLRNGKGATTGNVFSARVREGLPVSVPIGTVCRPSSN
nr:hypothetical protein [Pseudomonas sp. JR33AA]